MTPSEQSLRKKYGQQTREYLSEKVPKERREQVIWRLKKMVIEIQGHADCKSLPHGHRGLVQEHALIDPPIRPASNRNPAVHG